MYIESIQSSSLVDRLLFCVWARSEPKKELSVYPFCAKKIQESLRIVAVVDDILPALKFERSTEVQSSITRLYLERLPEMGFDEVYCLSDIHFCLSVSELLTNLSLFTSFEMERVITKTRRINDTDYSIAELFEFSWNLGVLKKNIKQFNCQGTISGIKTKFFYLAARKLIPDLSMHFVGRK